VHGEDLPLTDGVAKRVFEVAATRFRICLRVLHTYLQRLAGEYVRATEDLVAYSESFN
jgi:hypothetical protein